MKLLNENRSTQKLKVCRQPAWHCVVAKRNKKSAVSDSVFLKLYSFWVLPKKHRTAYDEELAHSEPRTPSQQTLRWAGKLSLLCWRVEQNTNKSTSLSDEKALCERVSCVSFFKKKEVRSWVFNFWNSTLKKKAGRRPFFFFTVQAGRPLHRLIDVWVRHDRVSIPNVT